MYVCMCACASVCVCTHVLRAPWRKPHAPEVLGALHRGLMPLEPVRSLEPQQRLGVRACGTGAWGCCCACAGAGAGAGAHGPCTPPVRWAVPCQQPPGSLTTSWSSCAFRSSSSSTSLSCQGCTCAPAPAARPCAPLAAALCACSRCSTNPAFHCCTRPLISLRHALRRVIHAWYAALPRFMRRGRGGGAASCCCSGAAAAAAAASDA